TGEFAWPAWILFGTVTFWLAGFDIIYACQDFDFDRKEGVHSIPARFGLSGALWLARLFHLITAAGFLTLFWMTNLSWGYLLGVVIALGILFYEHLIVKPADLSRVQTAFFTMNGALSITLFGFTLIDLMVLHQW
ncbi:UbiA family prenyltransferase, partial [Paenibacillus sepulcri]|nr:UbiA family prenyltransferase [Paenibacillus sepulcri]